MYYFEVLVRSAKFHGSGALTYSSENELSPGSVVIVPLLRERVLGIVTTAVPKPKFQTKPIHAALPDITVPKHVLSLIPWLQSYYPAPLGQIISLFLPASLAQTKRGKSQDKGSSESPHSLPPLTSEQTQAIQQINAAGTKPVLLHGDTGTGKTRVYMELIASQLNQAKSAIVLTPEIGLTPQLAKDLERAFPDRTVTLHSTLTPAERRDRWLRIQAATEPLIVVGPRSALFCPVKDVGLIVVDEAHDTAYKQEQAPHYIAANVAAKIAQLTHAQLIIGTATPLVSDYYMFSEKSLPIVRMTTPAANLETPPPSVTVVHLRDRDQFSRSPWLSLPLIKAIESALTNQEQSLVFLNRRGTARMVLCQNCGWEALCPRCDLPLTYHGDHHTLRCHTCGFSSQTPSVCPTCNSTEILFKSIGTKTIVHELERLFPKARISRFDSDTKKDERLEAQYHAVRDGSVDILVGTQMLGKGLDLPNLAVVGVVVADTSLTFPDYSAEERTFQLLTQVIGRVSRGHRKGTVVIQSYAPDSPLLKASIEKDYESFYRNQITERSAFKFPPFCFALKLRTERSTAASAQKHCQALAATLRSIPGVETIGPAPAFVEKVNNRYRWQLTVKSPRRQRLVEIINALPSGWQYDIDPINLL